MGIEIKKEGQLEQKSFNLIEPILIRFISKTGLYSETADKRGNQWENSDVTQIKDFLIAAAPYAHPKLRFTYFDHILLASIYAKKLTEIIKPEGMDPAEAQVLNLLHDLGRLIAPHEYFRNDLLERLMIKRSDTKSAAFAKLPPLGRILGINKPEIKSTDDLTLPQIILHVSDNLGKFNKKGKLNTKKDVLKLNSLKAYDHDRIWTSERIGLEALAKKESWCNELVIEEIEILEKRYGINFSRLRKEVLEEFNNYENRKWLFEAKEALEVLNPQIDAGLGRSPIKTVVFDVGGVLFKDSQRQLAEAIDKQTGSDFDKVKEAVDNLNTPGINSGTTSESLYLKKFCKTIGKEDLSLEEAKNLFKHPEIYEPTEGMQELIKRLSANKELDIWVFSDSIISVAIPLRKKLNEFFPEIDSDHILISAEVGGSKRDPKGSGIAIFLKRSGVSDPQTVLEIDDKPNYTEEFRGLYNTRAITFMDNPFSIEDNKAAERLKTQLQRANLI